MAVAIYCEMIVLNTDEEAVGKVTLVDDKLRVIYDEYVLPSSTVTDYRTNITGIEKSNLDYGKSLHNYSNGVSVNKGVSGKVDEIVKKKILIGHNIGKLTKLLQLDHPHRLVRDTAEHYADAGVKPSLKDLALKVAGIRIQEGHHDSGVNAKAIMRIYLKDKF